MTPYRVSARPDLDAAPRELVFAPVDRARRHRWSGAAFQFLAMPALAGWLVTNANGPGLALFAMALSTIFALAWWIYCAHADERILRVVGGELSVRARPPRTLEARFQLADLVDVILETRTVIEGLPDNGYTTPVMHALGVRFVPVSDACRIILVKSGYAHVPLGDSYIAHMDATDWACKIRLFLRKQGWVPLSEREPEGYGTDDTDGMAAFVERENDSFSRRE